MGGFCPSQQLRVSGVPIDQSADVHDQRRNGFMSTAFEVFVWEQRRKSFELFQP